jgi:lipoate-protein ligase B
VSELLLHYEIKAATRDGLTGVWVANRKIASIGVGVRHWITMHGVALNVSGDLSPFDQITPCGIADVTMTSIEKETEVLHSLAEIADQMAHLAKRRVADLPGSTGRWPVAFGGSPNARAESMGRAG